MEHGCTLARPTSILLLSLAHYIAIVLHLSEIVGRRGGTTSPPSFHQRLGFACCSSTNAVAIPSVMPWAHMHVSKPTVQIGRFVFSLCTINRNVVIRRLETKPRPSFPPSPPPMGGFLIRDTPLFPDTTSLSLSFLLCDIFYKCWFFYMRMSCTFV